MVDLGDAAHPGLVHAVAMTATAASTPPRPRRPPWKAGTTGRAHVGEHAVVLGDSLAGLAVAVVLAERFDTVTIIDRDVLPPPGVHRNGVPQGRHTHLLLPGGLRALAELLPGIVDDLEGHGAQIIDAPEFRFYLAGGRLALSDPSLSVCGATRPLLEGVMRRRVRGLPNVCAVERTRADGLVADPGGAQVTGVRVRSPAGSGDDRIVDATLTVDATGRRSRGPRWLAELGYPAPDEESLHVGVHYTTRLFRRDPADLGGCRHVQVAIPPGGRHGGVALAVEADRWLVTLVGILGERPPADLEEFVEHTGALWKDDLHAIVARAEPIGDAAIGAFPAYLRRRYDRLREFPGGYVVTGDAVCSLNPVYAQGMSVAIREAQALGEVLDRHGLDRVGQRFFKRARPLVDSAWQIATGADLGEPAVEGRRTAGWRVVNRYVNRLLTVAHRDPLVADAFLRVSAMVAPPQHLLRPRIASRVLRGGGRSA
jgi:2-polyprenyl-6-methoxyphenol hydroxylase-like FAD-dependent oxidoreductase